jgi:Subtilase family
MYLVAIFTSHVEFAATPGDSGRVVQNIWPIPANKGFVAPYFRNISLTHATEVAGVIGGKTVGVSPSVSMFGLDVFGSNENYASDSTIIAALERVALAVAASGKPSVVNMSLEGKHILYMLRSFRIHSSIVKYT